MIVVTDLDGTLLDHHNYSFSPAQPALAELSQRNIPVILNTSKTRAELVHLQQALGLTTPFVVENGSAIYSADHSEHHVLGVARRRLLTVLAEARAAGFRFRGYADMTVADVCDCTGLREKEAQASMAREYTEPLLWEDSAEQLIEFDRWIQARGLQCLKGGRFIHVMGHCDKGVAMQTLLKTYYPEAKGPIVALGDSDNDLAMLERADIAVCVRSPSGPELAPSSSSVIYTDECGPTGWAAAMTRILNQWGAE